MIILDTGGLYAFLDTDDDHHNGARSTIDDDLGPFILSPFVLGEVDYLVGRRLGVDAACALLDDVAGGVYTLVAFGDAGMERAAALVRQYRDLDIGVTDASVVTIAARYRSVDLLCTDQGHFRSIRPLVGGAAFRLLPLDHSG